jgi:outer membrane assembly lipoprotein YfiO
MKLLLAEEYFKNEDYPSAAISYERFHEFYPSNKHAEYAKYRSLLAKFYLTLKTDCDQSETEHALSVCNDYLNTPTYTKYRTDVHDIKQTCEHKLIDKEVYIFDFYLKQEQFEAAQKRLAYLRKTYLPMSPSLEPQLMYLECKLANKQKNQSEVKEYLTALAKKYPESEYTQMASALTTPTPFFF